MARRLASLSSWTQVPATADVIPFAVFAVAIALALAQAIAFGIAGSLLLKPVDREGAGFALGLFLGPIGLVITWAMRANELLEREQREKRHHPVDAALAQMRQAEQPRRFR